MKTNMLKFLILALMLSLMGAGAAVAGGYKGSYNAPAYGGYYHGGGYYHPGPYQHYTPGCGYNRYHHYGPPARWYPHNNYYRGYNPYNGAYYFSGAFSEPGFGFVFGTRGSW